MNQSQSPIDPVYSCAQNEQTSKTTRQIFHLNQIGQVGAIGQNSNRLPRDFSSKIIFGGNVFRSYYLFRMIILGHILVKQHWHDLFSFSYPNPQIRREYLEKSGKIISQASYRNASVLQTHNFPDIIELKHIRQTDSEHCGNKSSILGELLSRGFPIPEGFCLSINAYRQFGTDPKLASAFDTALRAASDRLFAISQFLAVRSSATAEDLPGVSYAGVYKSVIGVFELGDVGTAVQAVWKSYTSPSATAARKANKQDDVSGGMGVLIQPVINAELAGVCYSLDPIQPISGQIVISAGWGQGAGIVDGSIPADTLWLQRDDLAIVKRRIVEKDACFTMEQGVGLVRKPVLEPKSRAACLPDHRTWSGQSLVGRFGFCKAAQLLH
jgi:hypothetical protein